MRKSTSMLLVALVLLLGIAVAAEGAVDIYTIFATEEMTVGTGPLYAPEGLGLYYGRKAATPPTDPPTQAILYRAYAKFDLPSFAPGTFVKEATLAGRVRHVGPLPPAESRVAVYRAEDSWTAAGLSWTIQPSVVEPPLSVRYEGPNFDVTELINDLYRTTGVVSFALRAEKELVPNSLYTTPLYEGFNPNALRLEITIIPEPAGAAALAGPLAMFFARFRRTLRHRR